MLYATSINVILPPEERNNFEGGGGQQNGAGGGSTPCTLSSTRPWSDHISQPVLINPGTHTHTHTHKRTPHTAPTRQCGLKTRKITDFLAAAGQLNMCAQLPM